MCDFDEKMQKKQNFFFVQTRFVKKLDGLPKIPSRTDGVYVLASQNCYQYQFTPYD